MITLIIAIIAIIISTIVAIDIIIETTPWDESETIDNLKRKKYERREKRIERYWNR